MYAGVLHAPGRIEYEEVDYPKISSDEVIIKVKYAGVCGSDIPRVMTKGAYRHPLIPGHEFSGIVEETGESDFSRGQKVSVYPLIPCKNCLQCSSGFYHLCDNYNYLGSRCDGAFAEFVKCPSENVIALPEGVPLEDAVFAEPSAVGLHGVMKAGINKGDTIAIYGLGTIGLLVAQWAKVYGAGNIIGIDRNHHKHEIARKLGINFCIDSDERSVEMINEITDGGADAVFECAGSTQEKCILAAKKSGKIVLLGNSEEDLVIKKENVSKILRKELSIKGSWNSSVKDDWIASFNGMESGKVRCGSMITHRRDLSEIKSVFQELHKKSYPYLKVVFVMK